MGGTRITMRGVDQIAWFTDVDRSTGTERLRAVVMQPDPNDRPSWGSILRIALLGLLPRRFARRVVPVPAVHPDEWTGAANRHGPKPVLYNGNNGVVLIRGHTYDLPADGQTLIVLVDEYVGGALSIQTHCAVAPTVPPLKVDSTDKEDFGRRMYDHHMMTSRTWNEWLASLPIVAARLARTAKQ